MSVHSPLKSMFWPFSSSCRLQNQCLAIFLQSLPHFWRSCRYLVDEKGRASEFKATVSHRKALSSNLGTTKGQECKALIRKKKKKRLFLLLVLSERSCSHYYWLTLGFFAGQEVLLYIFFSWLGLHLPCPSLNVFSVLSPAVLFSQVFSSKCVLCMAAYTCPAIGSVGRLLK